MIQSLFLACMGSFSSSEHLFYLVTYFSHALGDYFVLWSIIQLTEYQIGILMLKVQQFGTKIKIFKSEKSSF